MNTASGRRLAAAAVAMALAATVTACSPTDQDTAPVPGGPSSSAEQVDEAGEHNDADTEFAQMMIAHHEGAVQMADVVAERSSSEQVRSLGERIAAAQGPEINLMSTWLQTWGEDVSAGGAHGGMDHGAMDMDGMSQEQAMTSLSELEGAELDRTFLELMIAHHQGAIEMAEAHQTDGRNGEARQLAGKIIDDQKREISEMENLLRDL